jgi:hypothetical protein
MPLLHLGAALVGRDAVQDVEQASDMMGRDLNGHLQGVHGPAQDVLMGHPGGAPLLHLLDGCWILEEGAVSWAKAQNTVSSVDNKARLMC